MNLKKNEFKKKFNKIELTMVFVVNKNACEVINVNDNCVELVSRHFILNGRWNKNDKLIIRNEWNKHAKKNFGNYNFMISL